jgi:hypothetical protein
MKKGSIVKKGSLCSERYTAGSGHFAVVNTMHITWKWTLPPMYALLYLQTMITEGHNYKYHKGMVAPNFICANKSWESSVFLTAEKGAIYFPGMNITHITWKQPFCLNIHAVMSSNHSIYLTTYDMHCLNMDNPHHVWGKCPFRSLGKRKVQYLEKS